MAALLLDGGALEAKREHLSGLVQRCPKLELLSAAGCSWLTASFLEKAFTSGASLRHLNAAQCQLEGPALLAFLRGCASLQSLSLAGLRLDHETLVQIFSSGVLQSTTRLDLSDLFITDDSLALLLSRATLLAELSISGCPMITDRGLEHMSIRRSTLTRLDLSKLSVVSNFTIGFLAWRLDCIALIRALHCPALVLSELPDKLTNQSLTLLIDPNHPLSASQFIDFVSIAESI